MVAVFPTPLAASVRFVQAGVSKVYFVPTIASTTLAATRAELTAGTDITNEIATVTGFSTQASMVETPDMGHQFVPTVPGHVKPQSSGIEFWGSKTGTDARQTFPQLTAGFLCFLDGGDTSSATTTLVMDVFPVRVASLSIIRDAGDKALAVHVEFAITAAPGATVAVPGNP